MKVWWGDRKKIEPYLEKDVHSNSVALSFTVRAPSTHHLEHGRCSTTPSQLPQYKNITVIINYREYVDPKNPVNNAGMFYIDPLLKVGLASFLPTRHLPLEPHHTHAAMLCIPAGTERPK